MRNKLVSLGLAAGFLGSLLLAAGTTSAWAQVQDKDQQGCINQLNKGGAKVAAAQGKENSGCVKNATKGKLTGTAEACLTADSKGKVGKAKTKNSDGEVKKCTGITPDFGATNATTGNTVTVSAELDLLHDIYGSNLDAAISTDKVIGGCQAAVAKAYEKLAATKVKQFLGCKKNGLKGTTLPQIDSAAELAKCLSGRPDSIAADPKAKVGKAFTKLGDTLIKKCVGVPNSAFPGNCSLSSGFQGCVDTLVECRVCLMLDAMDNLGADCDTFDDGVPNGSCPPSPPTTTTAPGLCGNGVKDPGEPCDPSAPSPDNQCLEGRQGTVLRTCNPDCTCTCPTRVEWEGNGDLADLDTGWTAKGHDAPVVNLGVVTFAISGCTGGTKRPCGQCNVSGPVDNDPSTPSPLSSGPKANNHRCVNDTSVVCSTNGDCASVGGTCQYFYGAPLPLTAGSVSTCVTNQIDGPLSGTVDVEAGTGDVFLNLISKVHTGPLNSPCPICTGDVTAADGVKDGTCGAGPNVGQPCDVSATHIFPSFGPTSFDCPPNSAEKVADLKIDLRSTTGPRVVNVTSASPDCTGDPGQKCLVDTCQQLDQAACFTDADCQPGRTCGGLRCLLGPNQGNPCTTEGIGDPACAPFPCGRPGEPTRVDSCTGGTLTCTPDATQPSPPNSSDEGVCSTGPFDTFCALAPWVGCTYDSDCPGTGPCTYKLRECFTTDGTTTGDTNVKADGAGCGPHVDDICSATAASLFGIAPTISSSVNVAAGLPGLGRLILPGTAGGLP